tara:strand:- start:1300 stop:1599 length:300 start_codon:yes stop_codon:yes gene_type:complete
MNELVDYYDEYDDSQFFKFNIENVGPAELGLQFQVSDDGRSIGLSADNGETYFYSLTKKEYDELLVDVEYWVDCGNYKYTNVEEALWRVLENAHIVLDW